LITLSSGNKLPFDKVLIAVGSSRSPMGRKQKNCFELNTLRDHAMIHNAIIKQEVNSIAIIGNTMRAMEIASSIRRYLDAIDKQSTKIYLITKKEHWFMEKLGLEGGLLKMVNDYLQRNRIYLFSGNKEINFEENQDEK
jgi:NADH dehydrogenase FAD-containing subunit